MFARGAVWPAIVWVTALAPHVTWAESAAPPAVTKNTIHVFMKDFVHVGCGDCGGLFGGGLLGWEDRNESKASRGSSPWSRANCHISTFGESA